MKNASVFQEKPTCSYFVNLLLTGSTEVEDDRMGTLVQRERVAFGIRFECNRTDPPSKALEKDPIIVVSKLEARGQLLLPAFETNLVASAKPTKMKCTRLAAQFFRSKRNSKLENLQK